MSWVQISCQNYTAWVLWAVVVAVSCYFVKRSIFWGCAPHPVGALCATRVRVHDRQEARRHMSWVQISCKNHAAWVPWAVVVP
jgi:hypothetical protein